MHCLYSVYYELTASTCAYARNIPTVVCAAPPEDEQVVPKTCTGC
jgi:hypothetical protein